MLAHVSAQTLTFEHGPGELALPTPEGRVMAEPGNPENHVCLIDTSQPHHTKATVSKAQAWTHAMLSLRVRVLDWTGSPPVIYAYLRRGKDGGLRALQVSDGSASALCWYGQDTPSRRFGNVPLPRPRRDTWYHLRFVCLGSYMAGKVWPEGTPEPGWQIEGVAPGHPDVDVAFGVWTHPRQPSSAKVIFDDVTVTAINPEEASRLGFRTLPRPALPRAVLPVGGGVFSTASLAGVTTDHMAVAFDSNCGDACNVVDLASDQEFVADNAIAPLFSGVLRHPESGRHLALSARDFGNVRAGPAPDGHHLVLHFSSHTALPVEVTVSIRGRDDGAVAYGFEAAGLDGWALTNLRFPQIPEAPALDGSGDRDFLLLPFSAGGLLRNPGSRTVQREADYPGPACAQFSAHYGSRAGLMTMAEDPAGHCKRFHVECLPDASVRVDLEHLFPEVGADRFVLPYPVVLRTFHGDWYDAAGLYRDWAREQPWCTTPLAERRDIPAVLKDGSGIIISGIRGNALQTLGQNLERVPDILDAYRNATGLAHMIFVPYGWENRGTWAGINYLPAYPSNQHWMDLNRELRRRGHRTAFMTSGYWWVVRRQETGSGPAFDDTDDFEARADICATNRDGSVWAVDNYDVLNRHGSWRGYSVTLCHGSRGAHEVLRDTFLGIAELGVPLVSFDQEIGGRQVAPCYHPDHGHPPGHGRWMWTGFRDLCRDILEQGKPIQPELGLFMENVSEVAIPYMATYWSRQFGEVDVACAGDRGIGLFPYLYHDYVTAIGAACVQGQGQLGTRASAELRCTVLANNLVRGLIPGPFMHDVPLDASGRGDWIEAVSTAYRNYCQPYARFPEFLVLGTAVRPPRMTCTTVPAHFYRRDGQAGEKLRPNLPPVVRVDVELPAVKAGSFRDADGNVCTVLANITGETQAAVVHLSVPKPVRLLTPQRRPLPVPEQEPNSTGLRLSLPPYGVLLLLQDGDAR